jgi:hypothetical protein
LANAAAKAGADLLSAARMNELAAFLTVSAPGQFAACADIDEKPIAAAQAIIAKIVRTE